MFDTREEVLNQLRAGEDGRAEFKEVRLGDRGVISPDTEDAAGGLAALANAAGRRPVPRHRRFGRRPRDSSGTRRYGRELDRRRRNAQLRAAHPAELLRKVLLPGSAGDEQRVLLAEVPRGLYVHRTIGWALLHADRFHQARPSRPRSLSGSSSSGAASTSLTSNPYSPHP